MAVALGRLCAGPSSRLVNCCIPRDGGRDCDWRSGERKRKPGVEKTLGSEGACVRCAALVIDQGSPGLKRESEIGTERGRR